MGAGGGAGSLEPFVRPVPILIIHSLAVALYHLVLVQPSVTVGALEVAVEFVEP